MRRNQPSRGLLAGTESVFRGWMQGIGKEQLGILLAFFVAVGAATVLSDAFLTRENLLNVLRQISVTGILAVGMTFVIITAGIDLSVGATLALVSVLVAESQQLGTPVAIIVGLAVGVAAGSLNGCGVAYGRIPPLIMTLASMYLIRGLAFLQSEGLPIYGIVESFLRIGNGFTLGLPNPVIAFLALAVGGGVLLRLTVFGRHIFASGANPEAARLSGVHVKRTLLLVYVLSGLTASIGGIIYTSQLGIGVALAGQGYELDAIAAVVIGGTSLFGGTGGILGTFLGASIVGIGNNLLNLIGVDPLAQNLVKGLIILAAVLVNRGTKAP